MKKFNCKFISFVFFVNSLVRGEKRRVSVHSSLIVVRVEKEENWNRCLVSRAISRNDLPPAFPPPQEDGRRTVALSFLFPFLSSSRPFSLSHTKISTYEIFDAEQRAPSRTVWFTAIFYLRISAFTVATQHGEPINFASAPIKTDTASLPREKIGTQFRRTGENVAGKNFFSKTGRIMLSKLYSLLSYLFFIIRFSLSLSGFSCWSRFGLGKSWTSLRNSIDKRDHRKLFHATLSANVLVPRRRFERGRADVRRHDAECVPKIRPHFGTAHRARWV